MAKQLLKNYRILLIDDDRSLCEVMEFNLREQGYRVDTASTGEQGLALFQQHNYALVITDMKMPGMDGMQVLKELHSIKPQVLVIMITAFASVEMAVEAMKLGAYDYVTKPVNLDEFNLTVKHALERYQLTEENRQLREELRDKFGQQNFITVSEKMLEVLNTIEKVAPSRATVLIQGESGTGKELLAKALHYQSERRYSPFITVNCAAIPKDLLESELFGYRKGAFTGAQRDKKGKFELADEGSIFLDEIGELPLELQTKLLRILEEQQIDVVGAETPTQIDVRIIAATNQDLEQLTKQGRFREDLFYRINVVPIHIPPLRERPKDIPVLFNHFLHKLAPGEQVTASPELLAKLSKHRWKGNVRELENLCKRMLLLRKSDVLGIEDLPWPPQEQASSAEALPLELPPDGLSLDELQKQIIIKTLEKHNWNQTQAAEYLRIPRHVLIYRLEKFGIKRDKT
jgi:two-component system NtrC family response regulator